MDESKPDVITVNDLLQLVEQQGKQIANLNLQIIALRRLLNGNGEDDARTPGV